MSDGQSNTDLSTPSTQFQKSGYASSSLEIDYEIITDAINRLNKLEKSVNQLKGMVFRKKKTS